MLSVDVGLDLENVDFSFLHSEGGIGLKKYSISDTSHLPSTITTSS
jgi:hypothetical protein